MKGLRFLLPLALAAALAIPAAVSAAPSPTSVSVSSNAQYLSPTTIVVQVTYTCPAPLTASIGVSVQEQNLTNATGGGFMSAPCTGNAQTVGIVVNGTGFTPGKAYANGFACAGLFCDTDVRQIQIVV